MDNSLLGSISKKEINQFRKDLLQMLRIGHGFDKYYGESNQDFGMYLKKFKTLIERFNKKYKNLKLKFEKTTTEINLKIFLNEKGLRECFDNAASKVMGLQSIGTSKFGTAVVSNTNEFSAQLEKIKNKLYLTYYNPQTGITNVFLQYNKTDKKVELVYELKEIENEPSPEFQLAAHYALNKPFDKKIDIYDEGSTLGFSSMLSHVEKADYFKKFDPHMSE